MNEIAVQSLPDRRRRPRARDAAVTRESLLMAALEEFCANGLDGARTATIARRAGFNIRMIYHYFGSKEGLYVAALERVYEQLRSEEEKLDLLHLDAVEGMTALVRFTFDHMLEHQEFIHMMGAENIQRGRFLKQSSSVPRAALPLVNAIRDLLERGVNAGVFRSGVDPVQLYISILSLSYVHISNRHTLSITFGHDLGDPDWLTARRNHACDVILGYLRL